MRMPVGERSAETPANPKGVNRIVTFAGLYVALRSRLTREDGQTMAEYGVVLAVVALACIVAFTALSGGISNAINNIAKALP
jgi:pilus assembly protein Flp/PilA